MNKISQITRRNIFDYLQIEEIEWSGKLEETDFLSRLYNLDEMESTDNRFSSAKKDIWQHRVNNYDWEDDWVFYDSRFDLINCEDADFLNFLCLMIHPLVRINTEDVNKLLSIFNDNLSQEGFEIVETTQVSGKPIFSARTKLTGKESIAKKTKEIKDIFNADYVSHQINLIETSIENQPYVAIGIAKELIETACKSIFVSSGEEYDKKWDLAKLMKETMGLLKLTPDNISNDAKAASSIMQILRSLTSVVQGISEVRNEYGIGHGKDSKFVGLQPRHAKRAVGAASTLAIYLLETHELRTPKPSIKVNKDIYGN